MTGRMPFWGVRAPASLKPEIEIRADYPESARFLGRSRPSLIEARRRAASTSRPHCFLGRSRPSLIEALVSDTGIVSDTDFLGRSRPSLIEASSS